MTLAALLPMRHDSERVPGKNYRKLAGVPLYHHVMRALQSTPGVDVIVIDTDSPLISEDAAECFPEVIVLPRPEHLRSGHVSMNEVLMATTARVPADMYLQTHSTTPFVSARTFERAIEALTSSRDHDSLFGVTRLQARLWTADAKPINHDADVLLRTQDLPPVFVENSCVYLFDRPTLVRRANRIGAAPMLFEIDPSEALDIDDVNDFRLAEMVAARQSP